MDLFGGIFLLGFVLMAIGALLLMFEALPSRYHGSKVAGGMVLVGSCLWLGEFLLFVWISVQVGP